MTPRTLDDRLFDELASAQGDPMISVFIPTEKSGREVRQGATRLKNRLREVGDVLSDRGWKQRQTSALLASATALIDDLEFWEHQGEGLAVFVGDDGDTIPVKLGYSPQTRSIVMPVFAVRELLPELERRSYEVLVLTKKAVRAYRAGPAGIEPLDVEMPKSFEDVNWFVDRETRRQQHPTGGSPGNRHGHDPSDRTDEDLARFLRAVASGISKVTDGPLVVLGHDDLAARFIDLVSVTATSPPNSGISDPGSLEEVGAAARTAIASLEAQRSADLLARLEDRMGNGAATTFLEEALPAAVSGRLEELAVIRDSSPVWGRFDEFSFDVLRRDGNEPQPGDVDLLERLVMEARKTGADLLALDSLPDDVPLVAVFRF